MSKILGKNEENTCLEISGCIVRKALQKEVVGEFGLKIRQSSINKYAF